MPRVSLPFGDRALEVQLPAGSRVLEPPAVRALQEPERAIAMALDTAAVGEPLRRLAAGRRSACIVIPDITRPAIGPWFLPAMTEALRWAGVAHIEILVATGSHRACTEAEVRTLVGSTMAHLHPVRSHDAYAGTHEHLGTTSQGTPLWIDRGYVQADLRIVIGLVEPHLMAGYSGGAKSVCPGIARLDTIRGVHRTSQARARVGPGIVDDNPFRREIAEAATRAGVDFSLQTCITPDVVPAHVAAGSLEGSVARALDFARAHTRVETDAPADVVLTTAAGAPLDRTLYQATKGWIAGLGVLRRGGDLILVAELAEGLGSSDFEELLSRYQDPQEVNRLLDRPDFQRRDQWMLQHVAQLRAHARLHLVSSLPAARVVALGVAPHATVEDALRAVGAGSAAKSLVALPRGPFCVASVGERLTTLEGVAV